ncbi:hypothetical protein [Leptolyngbya sp. FACHB-8]|uniref:hypothetical protein n=1 Tax=unclassified Leptolyngbya TaxID=2650499 RepID=UPI0016824CF0|nr:hypothetical protein [Leptolyngbya sp. FACHB-8]MBD1914089.1 hypothetical protein [Leptolyngbya sp. FACHB-8]
MNEFKGQKLEGPPVVEDIRHLRIYSGKKPNSQSMVRSASGYEILEKLLAIALILIMGYLGYSYIAAGSFSPPDFEINRHSDQL